MLNPISFHLPAVSSTNDYARELLATYPYVLVSANEQTRGRGRKGRTWQGAAGANVYVSFGKRHAEEIPTEEVAVAMARGALSVLDTCRHVAPQTSFRLKYPNDVQAHTANGWAKIAGVLVEHEFLGQRCASTVIGVGLNVEQTVFPDTITQPCTSIHLLGVYADVGSVLARLTSAFTQMQAVPWMTVHQRWDEELRRNDPRFSIASEDGYWMISRLLHDGRLLVQQTETHSERTISDGDTLRYTD